MCLANVVSCYGNEPFNLERPSHPLLREKNPYLSTEKYLREILKNTKDVDYSLSIKDTISFLKSNNYLEQANLLMNYIKNEKIGRVCYNDMKYIALSALRKELWAISGNFIKSL